MINTNQLGQRIRFFRKRAGLSQLELETAIDASGGTISRIENGEVNPTKETIEKITSLIGLNRHEVSYINGPLAVPVSTDAIQKAVELVGPYFSRNDVFSYLIDERFRIHLFSEGFIRLFSPFVSNPAQLKNKLIGKTIMEVLLDPDLSISEFIIDNNSKDLILFQLKRFENEMGFMVDDKSYQDSLAAILKNPFSRPYWEHLNDYNVNLNSKESKIVPFKFNNFTINLGYTREPLPSNPRFETLEYFPTNRLIKFMMKLYLR